MRIPPLRVTRKQMISLLGLWERRVRIDNKCRSLAQAAELVFGLPTAFTEQDKWTTDVKGHTFDVVQCAQRIYTGLAANESPTAKNRPLKWAQWVFSLKEVWQEDLYAGSSPSCTL